MQLERLSYRPGVGWSAPSRLDGDATLAILFGARGLEVAPAVDALRASLPRALVIGCSTAGEIHQACVRDDSIAAAVVRFDHTAIRFAHAPVTSASGSHACGVSIGHQLAAPDLRGVLVLSDGLAVNGSALAKGITESIGPGVVVTGGLAGDGDRFRATWVLKDDRPQDALVTAVGFYGERIQIGHGSKGGWDMFGPERVVTRSDGNILYELDHKPALALYKEYLGERASGLPATALLFPLAVRPHDDPARRLVRTVLAVDEPTQSMRFAGDVPQGAYAQLMRANFDRLVLGASDAALSAKLAADVADPVLSIAISCIGRRLVLKSRIEEETEATLDVLPPGTEQIGFYSYGELSPSADGACDLHNQTMTLTTLRELAAP